MEWSNEMTLKFLKLYEEEEILWNQFHENHRNRGDVHDAWKRLHQKMDGGYTLDELKKKKDSLMASFRTNYNKVKASLKNAGSTNKVYKPYWFAYEQMAKFLIDRRDAQKKNSIKGVQLRLQEENSVDQRELYDPLDIGNDGMMLQSNPKTSSKTSALKRKRIAAAAANYEIKNNMEEEYTNTNDTLQKSVIEKDMCDIYGELVAVKLRAMDNRTRHVCMHKMDTVMFETLMDSNLFSNQSSSVLTVSVDPNQDIIESLVK